VVDNASTHNTPTIHCWLLRPPRFHVHFTPTNFTPTSRSWMNLVERWFATLTEKQPRRGAHRSTPRAGGGHSALHRHHERAPEAVHVDEDGPIQDTRRGATKVAATMVAWSGLRIAMYALSDRSRYQDVQGPASGGRQGARPHQPRAGCAATRLRDRRRAGALVSRLGPTRETLRGAQRPAGFVERTDFNSVVSRLAPYLQNYTRFAYGSGWRKAEVAPLEWPAVDKTSTRSRCGAEHSKNGEPCVLPLVGELAEIIDRRRQDPYVHDRHGRNCGVAVHLPSKRRPDRQLPQGLDGGMHRGRFCQAEAPSRRSPGARPQGAARHARDVIFHDLRRSAVRNLMAAGVNQSVAMRPTGHQRAPDHQRLSALPDRLRRRRARGARADASRARERRRGPGAGWAGAQFGARNGSRDTLAGSKSLISKAGSWCSLVSTLDCQSRGRGFKSRRARHQFQ